jgi:hypothetical protein
MARREGWLRADPPFRKLVKDLELVQFWRETNDWGDFCSPTPDGRDFTCH